MKLLTSGYQLCYECHRRIIPVVEIGTMDENGHIDQEGGGTFCLACLRKAVVLLETILAPTQESPQHPRPGDFVAGEGHPHAAPGADAMKAIGRRDTRGQIIVYPEPRAVKSWWTGAIRHRRGRYLECHCYTEYVEWTDVTDEVREAMNMPTPPQEQPAP